MCFSSRNLFLGGNKTTTKFEKGILWTGILVPIGVLKRASIDLFVKNMRGFRGLKNA